MNKSSMLSYEYKQRRETTTRSYCLKKKNYEPETVQQILSSVNHKH